MGLLVAIEDRSGIIWAFLFGKRWSKMEEKMAQNWKIWSKIENFGEFSEFVEKVKTRSNEIFELGDPYFLLRF